MANDQRSHGDEQAGPHGEEVAVERVNCFKKFAAGFLVADPRNPASDGANRRSLFPLMHKKVQGTEIAHKYATILKLFLTVLLAHLLGDFPFQSSSMVRDKQFGFVHTLFTELYT